MAERTPEEQRSVDDLLASIRAVREEIEFHSSGLSMAYDRRIELWQEGRAMDPPVRQADLGEAAGVKEAAVINALRARREKAEKAAAS